MNSTSLRCLLLIGSLLAGALSAETQWLVQPSNTTADLRGIDAVSNSTAWASGSSGTVLRTVDGGMHWSRCADPAPGDKLDFRAVQAFDGQDAIVMSAGKGGLSRVYKTTDACATSKLVLANSDPDGFWDALRFLKQGKRVGLLIGDPVSGVFPIFISDDGGDHWRAWGRSGNCAEEKPAASQDAGLFAASNQAAFVWPGSHFAFISNAANEVLLWTSETHACVSRFSPVRLPLAGGSSSFGAFAFAPQNSARYQPLRGIVVGGDYKKPDQQTGTATFIMGQRIMTPENPPHGYRSSVAYDPGRHAWIAVGPNGTDISFDDGRNWHALKPGAKDAPDADRNWNALSLPFVVGPKGRIGKLVPAALRP